MLIMIIIGEPLCVQFVFMTFVISTKVNSSYFTIFCTYFSFLLDLKIEAVKKVPN